MPSTRLRRPVKAINSDGSIETLTDLAQATKWLAKNGDRLTLSSRTQRLLSDAFQAGNLRQLRAATKAIEEALDTASATSTS